MTPPGNTTHAARYQGRDLFLLVLSFCLPAALLFVRLIFGMISSDSRFPAANALQFKYAAQFTLVLFFVAQFAAALYQRRLLPPAQSKPAQIAQLLAVLIMGLLLSLVGAVILEAFGFNLFLRAGGIR